MSHIGRSRKSRYYQWALVQANLPGKSHSPAKVQKELVSKQQGPLKGKASLLDLMLDEKAGKRPSPSRAQPLNGKPRGLFDKDEFQAAPDNGAKGIPVRLSSADSAYDPNRTQESLLPDVDFRRKPVQWFDDEFEDPNKRLT